MDLELPFDEGAAQVSFQDTPALKLSVHSRLEEAVRAPAGRLGAVERDVGVAQQLVGGDVGPVHRGDADAGADVGRCLSPCFENRREFPRSRMSPDFDLFRPRKALDLSLLWHPGIFPGVLNTLHR